MRRRPACSSLHLAGSRPTVYAPAMTARKKPALVTITDYLAGAEAAETRHEYLGGGSHAMAGGTDP